MINSPTIRCKYFGLWGFIFLGQILLYIKELFIEIKNILIFIIIIVTYIFVPYYCEKQKYPYEIGSHMTYTIICENDIVYKVLSDNRGVIQILNSDGTPLKCGEKKY